MTLRCATVSYYLESCVFNACVGLWCVCPVALVTLGFQDLQGESNRWPCHSIGLHGALDFGERSGYSLERGLLADWQVFEEISGAHRSPDRLAGRITSIVR